MAFRNMAEVEFKAVSLVKMARERFGNDEAFIAFVEDLPFEEQDLLLEDTDVAREAQAATARLEAKDEAREQAAMAAEAERVAFEAEEMTRKASHILRARGHVDVAELLLQKESVNEDDRPYLEAALYDHEVPDGIKKIQVHPLRNRLDIEALANGAFGKLIIAMKKAYRAVFIEGATAKDAAAAKAAAEAGNIHFQKEMMRTIERIFVYAQLPGLEELANEFPEVTEAVNEAKRAEPKTKSSTLLREIKDRLWERIDELLPTKEDRHPSSCKGKMTKRVGKTDRKRAADPNRDAKRKARQLERSSKLPSSSKKGGEKNKKSKK